MKKMMFSLVLTVFALTSFGQIPNLLEIQKEKGGYYVFFEGRGAKYLYSQFDQAYEAFQADSTNFAFYYGKNDGKNAKIALENMQEKRDRISNIISLLDQINSVNKFYKRKEFKKLQIARKVEEINRELQKW